MKIYATWHCGLDFINSMLSHNIDALTYKKKISNYFENEQMKNSFK